MAARAPRSAQTAPKTEGRRNPGIGLVRAGNRRAPLAHGVSREWSRYQLAGRAGAPVTNADLKAPIP